MKSPTTSSLVRLLQSGRTQFVRQAKDGSLTSDSRKSHATHRIVVRWDGLTVKSAHLARVTR